MSTGRTPRFPPDELAETHDETPTLDVLEPVGRVARGSGDRPPIADVRDMHVATEVEGWEALGRLAAEIAEVRATAEAAKTDGVAARSKVERAQTVVFAGAGAILVGVVAVVKLAFFAGGRSNEEKQRDAALIEMRAAMATVQLVTVPELRAATALNAAAIAGLRGALDQISRLGAVRVFGPAPQPLLPDEP